MSEVTRYTPWQSETPGGVFDAGLCVLNRCSRADSGLFFHLAFPGAKHAACVHVVLDVALAHKKRRPPVEPPYDPRHCPTLGS
jgi:hypothetical protein